ncbi:MAG: hypothetical protein RSB69_04620 [Odoribacter sp.]
MWCVGVLLIAVMGLFVGYSKDSDDGTEPGKNVPKIGDYYYSDGTWSDGGDVAPDLKNGARRVIGIVFQTDPGRIGAAEKAALAAKGVTTPHGLVMALTNAAEGCCWGDYRKNEPDPFSDVAEVKLMYGDLDGYNKTKYMVDKITKGDYDAATYAAFNAVSKYGTGESAQFAAPASSTGWFLPGMGQWWDILVNLGGVSALNDSKNQNSAEDYLILENTSQSAVDHLNARLKGVAGATPFSIDTYFWSSSEYNYRNACLVFFDNSGYLYLGWSRKGSGGDHRVRSVLAF